MIKKAILKYEEKKILTARYYHKKSNDYLRYKAIVLIKESGKKPVEIHLKFDGIYPFVAPMPPEEYTIKAASILDLSVKLTKWFKKYGYELE
jgi:hypothetical protein